MRAIVCRGLADGGAPTHGSRDEHSSSSGVSFSFVGATQRPERDLTRVFLVCSDLPFGIGPRLHVGCAVTNNVSYVHGIHRLYTTI